MKTKVYLKTDRRKFIKIGWLDPRGNAYLVGSNDPVGFVNDQLVVFSEESKSKIGYADNNFNIYNISGEKIGFVIPPKIPFLRAKVFLVSNPNKPIGKIKTNLFASYQIKTLQWIKGASALLLLFKDRSEGIPGELDEIMSNWDLVFPTSILITILFLIPGFPELLKIWYLLPALGEDLGYIINSILFYLALFAIFSLIKRQLSSGGAKYAKMLREKYLNLINQATGIYKFDRFGLLISSFAFYFFAQNSIQLLPLSIYSLIAFSTLVLKADKKPWQLLPRYRKAPVIPQPESIPQDEYTVSKNYEWNFQGITRNIKFNTSINFNIKNVIEARNKNPFKNGNYPNNLYDSAIFLITEGEQSLEVKHLAWKLREIAIEYNFTEYEEIQNTLDFVQDIPYASDYESKDAISGNILGINEYWRFPIETLFDYNGDCDCKAILAASLFRLMGFKVLLLLSFDPEIAHAAVAVEGAPDFEGFDFFTYKGKKYYFCETTATSFKVGEQPSPNFIDKFEIIEIPEILTV